MLWDNESKRQYQARYFQKHKERHLLLHRETQFFNKLETLMHYSNPQGSLICNNCGGQNMRVLCLDHIAGGGNKQRKQTGTHGGINFYRWLKQNGFPNGYQVLCANCNMEKSEQTHERQGLMKRELAQVDKIK